MTASPGPSPEEAEPAATPEQAPVGATSSAQWRDWRQAAELIRTSPPMRTVAGWWRDDDPERPTPWWLRVLALVVAGWLAILLALFAGFLTPYRINGWLIPVSLVFVVAGLTAMTRFTYAVTRHVWLSILPGGLWLIVSLILSSRTREGDLVLVQQIWVAGVYLLLGSVTLGVLAYRMVVPRPTQAARPSKIQPKAKDSAAGAWRPAGPKPLRPSNPTNRKPGR